MSEEKLEARTASKSQTHDVAAWLRDTVTLSLPRWALLAAGLAGFVLLLVALD